MSGTDSNDLLDFVRAISDEPLMPYQTELLDMLESMPVGAKLITDLTRRKPPRVFAMLDGKEYCYSGNRVWKESNE